MILSFVYLTELVQLLRWKIKYSKRKRQGKIKNSDTCCMDHSEIAKSEVAYALSSGVATDHLET